MAYATSNSFSTASTVPGPGKHFLRGAQFSAYILPGGEPEGEDLKVFNFRNLHSWNEDPAQLRQIPMIPAMEPVSAGRRGFALGKWCEYAPSRVDGCLLLGLERVDGGREVSFKKSEGLCNVATCEEAI